MRALVCGGRDFDRPEVVAEVLSHLAPTEICHGGARGADRLAGEWAKAAGVPCKIYTADWKGRGRAAGALRNATMLRHFKPDVVVAFPGGAGTADMVARARAVEVPVVIVEPNQEKKKEKENSKR